MIKEAIGSLVSGNSLTMEEASCVMEEIMDGSATQAQLGAFLVALKLKGETADEVAGLASVMRARSSRVSLTGPVIDIVGTGGDGSNTFNISTTAAFVMAGAGLKVAKHGNRAMSSRCGSADVLEALGVKIELKPEQVQQCVEKVGIGFMFAQAFHPAMKYAAAPRREIGISTVFNILGPLTNPAGAQNQLMGVFHTDLVGIQTRVLQRLGARHVMVVYGRDGLDEISISGETLVGELVNGEIREYVLHPSQFGLEVYDRRAIQVSSVEESRQMILAVLENQPGPALNIVVLNAGAALYVAGVANSMEDGIERARKAIAKGEAKQKLDAFVAFTNKHAKAG